MRVEAESIRKASGFVLIEYSLKQARRDMPLLLTVSLYACVLSFLIVLQRRNYYAARRESKYLCDADLSDSKLWIQIREDIIVRSRAGQGPDWLRYSDLFDRFVLEPLENVRQFANAALATGVGGTMFLFIILVVGLELGENGNGPDPESGLTLKLRIEILLALLSSAVGITCHLIIVLRYLPKCQEETNRLKVELDMMALDQSRQHPPSNPLELPFGEMVRDELAVAFKDAVARFPEAFAQMDVSINSLERMIEKQGVAIGEASGALGEQAKQLGVGASKLAQASDSFSVSVAGIKESTDVLVAVPGRIEEALKEVLHQFDGLWESADSIVGQLRTAYREETTTSNRELVESLKKDRQRLSGEIENKLENLRAQSAKELRDLHQALSTLKDSLENDRGRFEDLVQDKLKAMHEQHLADAASTVEKVIESIGDRIDSQVLKPLYSVGEALNRTTDIMPAAATDFRTSLVGAAEALDNVPERLEEVNGRLEETAKLLEESRAEMGESTGKMVESVHKKMEEFLDDTKRSHSGIDETVKNMTEFIEQLIRNVVGVNVISEISDDTRSRSGK